MMKSEHSQRKRLAFKTVIVVSTYACMELISATVLIFDHGGIGRVWNARDVAAVMNETFVFQKAREDVVHPFIGFVGQPVQHASDTPTGQHITQFGFNDFGPPLHKRTRGKIIIGILGGSVAEQFAKNGVDALATELRKSPKFSHSKFVFVRMALPGGKQPQQLMIVNYLLTLGAEFDILINLDGFNEVALSIAENHANNVFPSFPRSWHTKIAHVIGPILTRLIGHSTYLKSQQLRSAKMFASVPLRYSLTMVLVWRLLHESKQRLILDDYERIDRLAQEEISYCAAGPKHDFTDEAELHQHCVSVWSRSSQLLHQLSSANGISYFHFLQPNQYVAGSKPMGSQETAIAIDANHSYRQPVVDCYPLLSRAGIALREQGVRFHDLTRTFTDHPQPLYIDNCCHVSKKGDLVFAREIGAIIRTDRD